MADQEEFGYGGLVIAHDLFAAWDRYQRDGDRARLQAQTAPLQDKLRTMLEHAARKSPRTKYHRQFAKNLLKRWPALWTFTHTDGVEPTNPRRTRPPRRRHLPQALTRQPIRPRRTHHRTTPLRLRHLPTPETVALRLLTQVIAAHARGDPIPSLA